MPAEGEGEGQGQGGQQDPPADDDQQQGQGVDGQGDDQGGDADAQLSPQERELKRARAEAAKYRTELRTLQLKQRELERKDLDEKGQALAKVKDLEAEIERLSREQHQGRLLVACAKAGAREPEDVAKLVGHEVEEEHWNSSLGQLKKRYPSMFGQADSPGGGSANGGAGGSQQLHSDSMNAMIRRAVGRQ